MTDRPPTRGQDPPAPATETLDPQYYQGRRRNRWSAPALLVGERLVDRFEIVRGLGQGGMGQVYEALDTELGQSVALKLIRPDLVLRPGVVERFKAEVRIAQRITHTNACRIFDFFQHRPTGDGEPKTSLVFLTMELLLGDTLADRLSSVALFPVDYATAVLKQIAAGLDAAHQADIVHGDLKPENIVFTGTDEQSRVVVTDFGLAFALGEETDGDLRGKGPAELGEPSPPRLMGTPAYMAPELRDSAPSRHSDVFAFGLVALEMLTGRRKWQATTTVIQPSKSTSLITPKGLLRARRLAATLPARLGSLIQACLEADPYDRPSSAGEILERLEPAPSATIPGRAWRAEVGSALPSRANWPFERLLSSAGDCQIWLARHAKTEEPRVFKLCDGEAEPTMLLRELTVLRLLRTELGRRDDLDRVLDWNLEGPTYFLEMEYSSAGDLVEWSESLGGVQNIPFRERMGLAADVAEALATIHEIGIAHGDLRPEAVLVEEHQDGVSARLTGFGHGHLADLRRLEVAGISSLEFSSPDSENLAWAEGALVDTRKLFPDRDGMPSSRRDVQAFGQLLFQLAVGDLTGSMADGWQQLVRDPDVVAIIESTAERDVDRLGEPPSAAGIATRVRQMLDTESFDRRARRRRNLAWLAALFLLFATSIGWMMTRAERQAVRARDAVRKAAVVEWLDEDPTLAAATLLELEEPGPSERALMRQVLGSPLARVNRLPPAPIVGRAAISPDGGTVAIATPEYEIYLWHTGLGEAGSGAGGDDLVLLGDHGDFITGLHFGPHGRRLLSTSKDNTGRIWTLDGMGDGAEPPTVLRGHGDTIWRGAFDPQGQKVVTPSEDRTARVWWVDGSREPVVLEGHEHWVIDARFDAEGRRVVTASRDGTVRVWNADGSGQPLVFAGTTKGEDSWFFHAEFSPDGSKVVAASRDGTAVLWPADGLGEPVVFQGHTRSVDVASFRPDGRQILTSSQDGTARVWPTTGGPGKIIARIASGESPNAEYVGDGRSVLLGTAAGPNLISTEPGTVPLRFLTGAARGGTKSDDERWMLTVGDTLRVWPLSPDPWSRILAEEETPQSAVGASPDGRRIALGSGDGTVRVVDVTGREEAVLRGHTGSIRCLAFHPKTGQLASGSRDDTVRIWSLNRPDDSVVLRGNEGTVFSVRFHPELDILLSAGFDGTVRIWNSDPDFQGDDASRLLATIPVSTYGLSSAVFGGAGAYILATDRLTLNVLSFSFDGQAVVSEVVHRLEHQPVSWVDSPVAGTRFATVGPGGVITVWDLSLEDGEIHEPEISSQWLDPGALRAHFDADGQRLALIAGPTAKIVDIDHPTEEPIILLGHDEQIRGDFLPDGRWVTVSLDRTVRIWSTQKVDVREALDAATDFCIEPEVRQDRFGESEEAAERDYEECRRSQWRSRSPGNVSGSSSARRRT